MKHKIRGILMEKKIHSMADKEKKSWSFHVLDTLQNYYWKENRSFPLSLLTVDLEECLTKHGYVLYGD